MVTTQDMVTAAQEQLAAFDEQFVANQDRVKALASELASIEQTETEQEAQLNLDAIAWQKADQEHRQAEQYARMMHRTSKEQEAIKAASATRKALSQAKQKHEQMKQQCTDTLQALKIKRVALSDQLDTLSTEITESGKERMAMKAALDQAKNEQGMAKYNAHLAAYYQQKRVLKQIEADLLTSQMDLHDIYTQALDDLRPYSALRRAMADLEEPDDLVLQAAHAALNYANAMLAAKYKFDHSLALDSMYSIIGTRPMFNALILPENDVLNAIGQSTHGDAELRRRCALLTSVIYEYSRHLRDNK